MPCSRFDPFAPDHCKRQQSQGLGANCQVHALTLPQRLDCRMFSEGLPDNNSPSLLLLRRDYLTSDVRWHQ